MSATDQREDGRDYEGKGMWKHLKKNSQAKPARALFRVGNGCWDLSKEHRLLLVDIHSYFK